VTAILDGTELVALAVELVAALPDPAAELELWRVLCREADQRGYERGHRDGYLQAVADIKRAQHQAVDGLDTWLTRWRVCCRPCRLSGHREGCANCQARTQATFAEPHPDDFTGLEAA
jgi:hypothetical protein